MERHHYAHSYVASPLRYGIWDQRGALLGVAVLSVPVRQAVLTSPFPELEPFQESLELGRFVLVPTPGVGVAKDRRVAAVAIADLVAVSLSGRDGHAEGPDDGPRGRGEMH